MISQLMGSPQTLQALNTIATRSSAIATYIVHIWCSDIDVPLECNHKLLEFASM